MRALHAIWVAAMTLALFSITSFGIFAIWAFNNPAFPKDLCVITKKEFVGFVFSGGDYYDPHEMEKKDVKAFVARFNGAPPKAGPADGVTVLQHKDIPLLRVVFTKGDCFLNSFDMPIPAFLEMLVKSRGTSI